MNQVQFRIHQQDVPTDLTSHAANRIRQLCVETPSRETGGLLLARGLTVGAVTGPGPAAICEPRRLVWDPSYIAGTLDALEYSDLRPVGRWHKHVSPFIRASEEDQVGAQAFREALSLDWMVDLIVATGDGDEPIAYGAYLSTAHGYSQIDCIYQSSELHSVHEHP